LAVMMPEIKGRHALRIAHVVAHVSPDGRYGGPLRVAADLANAQRANGHDTSIVATFEGYATTPLTHSGVRLAGFPAHRIAGRGFAGLVSVALIRHVLRARHQLDIVHIHVARDALTAVVALALSATDTKYVLQTHGMIEPKGGRMANWYDRIVLRRAARRAQAVMVLTEGERRLFSALGVSEDRLTLQVNGIALHQVESINRHQVLFLARLHPRKGALAFAVAALALAAVHPTVTFTIAGPDEGDGAAVADALANGGNPSNVRILGAIATESVQSEMASSLLYVLPAVQEPFGLTILEALGQSTPVLVHRTAALASAVLEAGAGDVFDGGPAELATAIDGMLRDLPALARSGARGRVLAESYAIETISAGITDLYFAGVERDELKP
jgi:glycosyltransferase involved in cell wall biosynthesis